MFEPEHIFDACRRVKLNQKPACQELHIRLKKGPKYLTSDLTALNLKEIPRGNVPEGTP